MTKELVIALDVGGTTTKAAAVTETGEFVGEDVQESSHSTGQAREIIDEMLDIIDRVRFSPEASKCIVRTCGIAIPGPFDYDVGVSFMDHKFKNLYGIGIGYFLEKESGLKVTFLNDAAAFGKGVAWKQLPHTEKFMGITIGTGLGSTFVENGEIRDAELWKAPLREGIFEDYVSKRALMKAYSDRVGGSHLDPEGIYRVTMGMNIVALDASDAFQDIGVALGEGLKPVIEEFEPEKVVVGGGIARSFHLFGHAANTIAKGKPVGEPIIIPVESDDMGVYGAARHAWESQR